MTNEDLITIKKLSQQLEEIAIKEISNRRTVSLSSLYTETKYEDEKKLSSDNPYNYYLFKDLNVAIYIYIGKKTFKYSVCLENWQPKPYKIIGNKKIYKNRVSVGFKDTLNEALELFYSLIKEYLSQKLSDMELLF